MLKALARKWINRPTARPRHADPLAAAVAWIARSSLAGGGVIVHSGRLETYPEVTGYLVPTLLDAGQDDLALAYLKYLLAAQAADGSFGIGGAPYVFDTCQVLEAFISAPPALLEQAKAAVVAALRWLRGELGSDGMFKPKWHDAAAPTQVHLRGLRNAVLASRLVGDSQSEALFEAAARSYISRPENLVPDILTHFFGYVLDGVAWFEPETARRICQELASRTAKDGTLPAKPGANWVCFPGLAQIALWWDVFGMKEPAGRALNYLCRVQRRSGGFSGGNGEYFPRFELSWTTKFFVDLWLRMHGPRLQAALPIQAAVKA